MPLVFTPHPPSRVDYVHRAFDFLDGVYSPGRRSGLNMPLSQFGTSEPHPMVGEAWDNLRRSLVYFRGQPVGTIATLDNVEEKLNYDQQSYFSGIWEKSLSRRGSQRLFWRGRNQRLF